MASTMTSTPGEELLRVPPDTTLGIPTTMMECTTMAIRKPAAAAIELMMRDITTEDVIEMTAARDLARLQEATVIGAALTARQGMQESLPTPSSLKACRLAYRRTRLVPY